MFLYRLALALAAPVIGLVLLLRVIRGRESRADLRERLGAGGPESAPQGPVMWLHGASVGEVTAARALVSALLAREPALRVVVTTNTLSGRQTARDWALPRLHARLAPLDYRACLTPFLARHAPKLLAIVENEVWPNRLTLAHRRRVPVALLSARLSERSARRWSRLGWLTRPLLAPVALAAPQDANSATRLSGLGLPESALTAPLELKSAVSLPVPDAATLASLGFARTDTLLAASTHEGEEEQVLAAFTRARAHRPELRLILAPRHVDRAPAIADLIAATGLAHATRSRGEAPGDAPVYLADTMGEMGLWYAAAGMCFTGGSLVPRGGHTPYEPVRFGCALLHGPDVANAAEPYARLDAADAAHEVANAHALAAALIALHAPEQQAMAARAARALPAQDLTPLIRALGRLLTPA